MNHSIVLILRIQSIKVYQNLRSEGIVWSRLIINARRRVAQKNIINKWVNYMETLKSVRSGSEAYLYSIYSLSYSIYTLNVCIGKTFKDVTSCFCAKKKKKSFLYPSMSKDNNTFTHWSHRYRKYLKPWQPFVSIQFNLRLTKPRRVLKIGLSWAYDND